MLAQVIDVIGVVVTDADYVATDAFASIGGAVNVGS
jgi:hypothetical protein